MCVNKEVIEELCELFPLTAENLKKRSIERRAKFMEQKNLNSIKFEKKLSSQSGGKSKKKSEKDDESNDIDT